MKAVLVLDDGTVFEGASFGSEETVVGEVVFNTGMTGYQEVLTDPSYCGQIVTMTYPLIGNYGINDGDSESSRPQVKGFIVRELCDYPSNWRSKDSLGNYLAKHRIVGIQGIDTRALTRILREKGTMNGVIGTGDDFNPEDWLEKVHTYRVENPVEKVTVKQVMHFAGEGYRIALLDFGFKGGIVDSLRKRGCEVYVFPCHSKMEDILAVCPDGIMLSNGPGDPKDCTGSIETIRRLFGKKPIFGICLGHQLTALAAGADTGKLKYGHRGCNHPVKDVQRDITYITSQNHGYTVQEDSLAGIQVEISHVNMNDGTVEGLRYLGKPVFTVQFHPEASPGPRDTGYLFDSFLDMIARER